VTQSRDCRLIVQTIAELAHGLGLSATAEGVETVEQLQTVRELGCDIAQGYLIATPMEPEALAAWKKAFRREWPKLMAAEPLTLWSDVEADALGER
jgi:EAL domain-containing protein (putative c-di-GMP-specific phosphodiesterase class I)